MIYGREYGADSSDCQRCESHSALLTLVECEECGAPGCDRCMTLQAGSSDPQTGYRDERYSCGVCESLALDHQPEQEEFEPADMYDDPGLDGEVRQ